MSIQTELTRIINAKAAIKTAIEGKGVTVPDATLLDGMASLIESIEAGGGTISGRKFISGEITFSETPTSNITISHDSVGFRSQPFVFLANTASAPSDHIGALISARRGSGVYVNSSKRFSLLSTVSETIDYYGYVNDTSFEIKSASATKMLAGKTYIWFRIEL
ncbi:MAG: hypothetical protein PUK39_04745 [Clostridiales bacterium]|nr:hypothetical protein [Clostridiales bacterium]